MSERRYLHEPAKVRLETRAEGKPPVVVGYGAVFYRADDPGTEYRFGGVWDDFTERIMPGAFDRAVREDDVRALFNHDPSELLGRTPHTLRLSVDAVGLRYEIDPPDTESAKKVVEAIRRGDLSGSSFGFFIEDQTWREVKRDNNTVEVIRELRAVKVLDVGPVTFPAYTSATTSVRTADELADARSAFDAWRHDSDTEITWIAARARVVEIMANNRKRRMAI